MTTDEEYAELQESQRDREAEIKCMVDDVGPYDGGPSLQHASLGQLLRLALTTYEACRNDALAIALDALRTAAVDFRMIEGATEDRAEQAFAFHAEQRTNAAVEFIERVAAIESEKRREKVMKRTERLQGLAQQAAQAVERASAAVPKQGRGRSAGKRLSECQTALKALLEALGVTPQETVVVLRGISEERLRAAGVTK